MKTATKRFLAILLVIAMSLSLMPVIGAAAETTTYPQYTGETVEDGIYVICAEDPREGQSNTVIMHCMDSTATAVNQCANTTYLEDGCLTAAALEHGSNHLWKFAAADGGITIESVLHEGYYLNSSRNITQTAEAFTLTKLDNGSYTIQNADGQYLGFQNWGWTVSDTAWELQLYKQTTVTEPDTGDDTDVIRVACVGDSLTDGYLSSGGSNGKKSTNAYPAQLQTMLGTGYEVKNFGTTSATLMDGGDKPYKTFGGQYQLSLDYEPNIVIIMLGSNDCKDNNWDADQYKEDAIALVNAYKALPSVTQVYFATSPRCYAATGDITTDRVDMLNAVQDALIAEQGWDTVDMYALTEDQQSLYNADGIHFTDEGYYYIAQCMYTALTGNRPLVEESAVIPHTQEDTTLTNHFVFPEGRWDKSTEHNWSKAVDASNPSATYYEVKFTGHQIDIYAGGNTPMGKIEYQIDGVKVGEFDLYLPSNSNSRFVMTIDGLPEGEHTLRGVALGTNGTGTGTGYLIDAAEVVVYSYREMQPAALKGAIVDDNLQYTADKYAEVNAMTATTETLTAWKNDKAVSQISLLSVDAQWSNLTVTSSDFTTSTGQTISKDNVDLQFITSVLAYTGMPGYGNPDRAVPEGSRAEANEVLYQSASEPITLGTNQLQNVWVTITVPEDAAAGTYTGTITAQADGADPLAFVYTLEVADATLPDATDFKDGFDIELWQNPYRVAEYYNVTPFSEEHFEILRPHMELYKQAGGHTITATIVDEAWAGQTYGEDSLKFPSMVKWTKNTDGTWSFDYTDFDAWVEFNQSIGIGDRIVCYSPVPWSNAIRYFDEATQEYKTETLTNGSAAWEAVWRVVLESLADHLVEKGWYDQAYIGIDERGFSESAFDLIESITRGAPYPKSMKTAGAMDGFVSKWNLAMRVDVLSVGSIAVKEHEAEFAQLLAEREAAGLTTTVYTCTGHKPGSFSLSAPGESYWTMMYAYSVGGSGYMRWAYDSWVEDPLVDSTHNAFEAGDCFLVYPEEVGTENPETKSTTRFEKMAEGVRDVNKLMQMKEEVPSMTAEVDALLATIESTYSSGTYYLTEEGKAALAADMQTVKEQIHVLTLEYIALRENGTNTVSSIAITGGTEGQTLIVGDTLQLTAVLEPDTLLNNTVTWTTSNPSVATVANGLVTAVYPGEVTITASSVADPSKSAELSLVVENLEVEESALVSYYSFDEMEDDVVTDSWGTRNGTNVGGTLVPGKSGNAISMDQVSDHVTFPTDSTLTDNWTISYWIYDTSTATDRIAVLGNGLGEEGTQSLDILIDSANMNPGVRVRSGSGGWLTYKNYTATKNAWMNVTWTQDKTTGLTLYINGQAVETNAWTRTNDFPAPIECLGVAGFTGYIDELKIYNRALTAAEVSAVTRVNGIYLAESEIELYIGNTYQIVADLVTGNPDRTLTYTSMDPEIVSVSSTGLLTGLKKGQTVIVVENAAGGFREELRVTCSPVLYSNNRIPQYDLPDEYTMDLEKAPGTDRQYLGQPDMIRTKTGRLITAYPVGHGHGPIVMRISDDDGVTWTEKTDIPASWEDCQETPTLYALDMGNGQERLMLISACPSWDLNKGGWETSYSDDNGETWTEYEHFWPELNGSKHATIVAMASLVQMKDENGNYIQKWMGVYHNASYVNYKTYLTFENGVETWSEPEPYLAEYRAIESTAQICEVGMFRSPDGNRIMALARSQSHAHLTTMFYSDDEGETWSEPIYMQGSLAGERHKAIYDPISGRLVITFREIRYGEVIDSSWVAGEWVAWVGTYEDLLEQREGQYRIVLGYDYSMNAKSGDTGYAGLVVLEDGTIITDSYGHFDEEFSTNAYNAGGYNVKTDLCYIKLAKFKLGVVDNALGLVDRTALQAKVTELGGVEKGCYTTGSYEAYTSALAAANAALSDMSMQQSQLDAAQKALQDAYNNLKIDKTAHQDDNDDGICDICGRLLEGASVGVVRLAGSHRWNTALKVADEMKANLDVEKFDAIIIASGNGFADALAGSYLSTVKSAPILLSWGNGGKFEYLDTDNIDYIKANLAEGGTVYLLGGTSAVPELYETELSAYEVKRLGGKDRFETNLMILEEAGVAEGSEILVCTSTNFADSLSASATGKPILLVFNESGKLYGDQPEYLAALENCTFTVIGGESAVSEELAAAIGAYGEVTRLAGGNRFETSVLVAEKYFEAPETAVLAYAWNYPDGLCGGALAYTLDAPLILTMTKYEAAAVEYAENAGISSGIVLGGDSLISDAAVRAIFAMDAAAEIIVK